MIFLFFFKEETIPPTPPWVIIISDLFINESNSDIDTSSDSEPELNGSAAESVSAIENDKTSVSSFTPDIHNETSSKKRHIILQDRDSEDEVDITTGNHEIKASNPRKRRVVISDDEE